MARKKLFDNGWYFYKAELEADPASYKHVKEWRKVDIPHDYLIEQANALYEDSRGWYKKSFNYEIKSGVRVSLRFDGVYMDSTVYVNGKRACEWKYGYTTFETDVTELLKNGQNEIFVDIRHQSPNTRWYSGAGIYRDVWFIEREGFHFVPDGLYVSSKKSDEGYRMTVVSQLANETGFDISNVEVRYTLVNKRTGEPKLFVSEKYGLTLFAGKTAELNSVYHVENVKEWDIDSPELYELKAELFGDDMIFDSENAVIGFKDVSFKPEEGFILNGRKVKIHGTCEHHDLGALGAAFNKEAMRRRLLILREMGVNAVRTAHNPPAPGLLELTDEMGFLVMDEIFDMWLRAKTTYDYARFFEEWHKKDVESWIRRDRNHVSIIMWSIGNEIPDTHADVETAPLLTEELRDEVYRHDPYHNAVVTMGSNYMTWEPAQNCMSRLKIAGYNYNENLYQSHHEKYPDWVIYGSETASTVQSRGIYHFPATKCIMADDDEQCSGLDNCTTSWGASSIRKCIYADRDTEFGMGMFIWSGFDYIGEPTPYHTRNSYFGAIDTAGLKKDAFYIYCAEWTDYRKKPMVHLFPYWDFNVGQKISVRIASNAPEVELFLNNVSCGRKTIDHLHGKEDLLPTYELIYEPGELKAVAYDEEGNVIATDTRHSFGEAEHFVLFADKDKLRADGLDIAYVTVGSEDKDGYPVDNANLRFEVCVEGEGRLLGIDNGDSTDTDEYKTSSKKLFSGYATIAIGTTTHPGNITVKVSGNNIKPAEIILFSEAAPVREGVSAEYDVLKESPAAVKNDVDVRAIKLECEGGRLFDENTKKLRVRAKIYPENAAIKDISWRATNELGVTSPLARVEVSADGREAVLHALGDGDFRLRCTTNNGTDKVKVISELEFRAEGVGTATIDPYNFVYGLLASRSNVELLNGIERGVASRPDTTTYIIFDNVDFGRFGSDTVNVPLFELESEPTRIDIWEGVPGEEGSECLCEGVYHKRSIWHVYQDNVMKLKRRLKGIKTLTIVVYKRVNIKGFEFEKADIRYERLYAEDRMAVYGDEFSIVSEGIHEEIRNIGNNVTVEFGEMDFGEEGAGSVTICGRTPLETNTIHLMISDENGSPRQALGFRHSENNTEMTFGLEGVKGRKKVTLVFMPGSAFDLSWIQFNK